LQNLPNRDLCARPLSALKNDRADHGRRLRPPVPESKQGPESLPGRNPTDLPDLSPTPIASLRGLPLVARVVGFPHWEGPGPSSTLRWSGHGRPSEMFAQIHSANRVPIHLAPHLVMKNAIDPGLDFPQLYGDLPCSQRASRTEQCPDPVSESHIAHQRSPRLLSVCPKGLWTAFATRRSEPHLNPGA